MTPARSEDASAPLRPAESLEQLFAALEGPLLLYALRLLGERSAAEDAVQEVFMRLHAHFAEVREPRRWLYRAVHNLALNQRRRSDKVIPLLPPAEALHGKGVECVDPEPMPDEQLLRLEGIGLVRLSLSQLDARSREVIRLKFTEELSYKEIAAQTGLSVGNVGFILHHALKTVASELARSGLIP